MTTCATNQCGYSGSSASFFCKKESCGAPKACAEFAAAYSGAEVIFTVCACGRYVVPETVPAGTIVSFAVPRDAADGIVVDLSELTKRAVLAATPTPAIVYPAYPALAGVTTTTPAAIAPAVPRVRVYNTSDGVVKMWTGDSLVKFEGVCEYIGTQPGETLDVMFSPSQLQWIVLASS